MKKATLALVAGTLTLASAFAFAQMPGGHPTPGGPGHPMPGQGPTTNQPMMGQGQHMQHMMRGPGGMHGASIKGDNGPSSLAFNAINAKMHQGMDITFTGNADIDFVKGMIPHHQGAIDMAKTVLAFGKDPEVKKLAEAVIKAQESEIALLQEWLKKNAR